MVLNVTIGVRRRIVFPVRVCAGLALACLVASAAGTFSVQVLSVPAGFTNAGIGGINDAGQVAGSGVNTSAMFMPEEPFIATPSGGVIVPLPEGWGETTGSGAINNLGQTTGQGIGPLGGQAFIGSSSGFAAVPAPAGWQGNYGTAINDSGQGTGYGHSSSFQAFVGTASNSFGIPLPTGWDESYGVAINQSGEVAGYALNLTTGYAQAFVGTVSGSTVIPLPAGWSASTAGAINDSGQVAGIVFNGPLDAPGVPSVGQAFIGTASGTTLIPLSPGVSINYGQGVWLNNAGTVVGNSSNGAAWIWDAADGAQLLSNLAPPGWTITRVTGLSQNGMIAAMAKYSNGPSQFIELVPVPASPSPLPTITSVANGATYIGGGLVPGSWAQAKGSNLASVSSYTWQASDFAGLGNALPTNLQGTSVTVNGTPAAVYYVDSSQVDFQVPAGVSGLVSVQVTVNGVPSNIVQATSVAGSPGVFPVIVNGVNYAAGVFADGDYVGDPSIGPAFRNAVPGDEIQLFATGLAPSPAGTEVTQQTLSGVIVLLGGVEIDADFAGLVAPGEFQVNFKVPQNFETSRAGPYSLQLLVGDVFSPATIDSSPPSSLVIPVQP